MASIDRRPNGTWRARWRQYAGGPQRTKAFTQKIDAERFLVETQHALHAGTYVEPAKAKVTLSDYAEAWLERMKPTWRPSTVDVVTSSLRRHVLPQLGQRPLTALRRADVEAWAVSLALAPTTVATVRQHLGQLLTAAVDDGLIPRKPAVAAPACPAGARSVLSPSQSNAPKRSRPPCHRGRACSCRLGLAPVSARVRRAVSRSIASTSCAARCG